MENTRRKIILVDDIKSNLDQGKAILNPYYQVYPAPSAEKLFQHLEKIIPDLILLDIEMPEMNGYEALKKLKADERYSDIPVIFLTAKSEEDSVHEGSTLGAAGCVTKPFSTSQLLECIENSISLRVQSS